MRPILISLCVFLVFAGTCFAQDCATPALGTANNKFGLDVYRALLQQKGSVFFSPYSIFSALQMTADGAKGTTAAEMLQTLYSKDNPGCIHAYINKSQERYERLLSTGDSIHIANSLWVQNSFPTDTSFANKVTGIYKASIREMDFINKTEETRKTINDWVEVQTHQRIKELLVPGTISRETKIVLVNTIWLKANWLFPFDPHNTKDEMFYSNDMETKTSFMHTTRAVNYTENEIMQAVELPYQSKKISMLVFLPVKGKENEFAQKMDAGQFTQWIDSMETQKTAISLPKFKMNSSFNLNVILQQLGMHTAFSTTADFSGISKTHLEISDVIHKAFIEVDEDGTEAAAATSVTMMTRSIPPTPTRVFKADRPFVFFLYDKEAKTILFMGKMEKP